jgi:hypothetical protein
VASLIFSVILMAIFTATLSRLTKRKKQREEGRLAATEEA